MRRLLQRIHLLIHHTLSLPALDLHSPSLPILRYHLPQASLTPDHASWMDLSALISSLGTRMEELVVISDTRFYSIECIEDRLERQNGEMMTYLCSMFPPPPP